MGPVDPGSRARQDRGWRGVPVVLVERRGPVVGGLRIGPRRNRHRCRIHPVEIERMPPPVPHLAGKPMPVEHRPGAIVIPEHADERWGRWWWRRGRWGRWGRRQVWVAHQVANRITGEPM